MVGGRRRTNRYGRKRAKRWPLVLAALGGGWLMWHWLGADAPAASGAALDLAAGAGTREGLPDAPVVAAAGDAPTDPFAEVRRAIDDRDLARAAALNQKRLADGATATEAKLYAADIAVGAGQVDEGIAAYEALVADASDVGAKACMRLAEHAERTRTPDDALAAWTRAWRHAAASPRRSEIGSRAQALAQRTVLAHDHHPGCVQYIVEPGDSLSRIAATQQTTVGLLRLVNPIKGDLIYRGDRLKIVRGPARLVVEKSRYAMALFLHGTLVREYQVCIGTDNRTPAATFVIQTKIVNPDWFHRSEVIKFGDPRNILGTRWLGFQNQRGMPQGLGIHGTTEPDSIPGTGSKGCVRLRNADVEELFGIVDRGAEVEIRD